MCSLQLCVIRRIPDVSSLHPPLSSSQLPALLAVRGEHQLGRLLRPCTVTFPPTRNVTGSCSVEDGFGHAARAHRGSLHCTPVFLSTPLPYPLLPAFRLPPPVTRCPTMPLLFIFCFPSLHGANDPTTEQTSFENA
ncbi:hypothetical protein BJV77DRAFT_109184 [Russula vinacea]|nr:hypothetical protein BJV77DRAFT_109184 [Russula vinacea]